MIMCDNIVVTHSQQGSKFRIVIADLLSDGTITVTMNGDVGTLLPELVSHIADAVGDALDEEDEVE